MSPSSTIAFFTTLQADVGSVLVGVVPQILTLAALLIGLGIGIYYFRKWIGRKA
jgi:hypothetical protein